MEDPIHDFLEQWEPFDQVRCAGVVRERGQPITSLHCTRLDSARLIFCREGCSHLRYFSQGQPVDVWLKPGEVLFVARDCWLGSCQDQDYLNTSIILLPEWPRFTHVRIKVNAGEDNPEVVRESHNGAGQLSKHAHHLVGALETITEEAAMVDAPTQLVRLLLYAVAKACLSPAEERKEFRPGQQIWQAACEYIQFHYNNPITRESVAASLNIHPNHLSRIFTTFGQKSFQDYLIHIRLERAKELLTDTRWPVAEIARITGFTSNAYFSRAFRGYYGDSPRSVRKLARSIKTPA